jgi:hypothetical protein
MILAPKPNPRKGESFVSHNSDLRRSGYTLSRSWKRVSGLLFHGQIERHAAHLVAMDGAIHFVNAGLQVHL